MQRLSTNIRYVCPGYLGVSAKSGCSQYSRLQLQLHSYPGGICWLGARDKKKNNIGLQIIAFAGINFDLQPPNGLKLLEKVHWCWKHWHEGNTLLVLDDVKNYSDIKPYSPPQSSQFKVLITTRLKLNLPDSLFLEVLREEDALELLAQLIESEKITQELEKAKELCQRLGYLPLALQLVGRYVKEREISLVDMLQRLEKEGLGHKSMDVEKKNSNWTLNIERGVTAAFELSWKELTKPAQKLGCLLSLFALAPIPWFLVENADPDLDSEELENARVKLEKLHLLLGGKGTYQLHQLIREFLKNKQNNLASANEQKQNFCQALVKVAKEIPHTPTLLEITRLDPVVPHLISATDYKSCLSNEDLILPFVGLARFFQSQGLYAEALLWRDKCLSVAKERLGEEHSVVANSYNNLAKLHTSLGRYTKAEQLYNEALALRTRLLKEEDLDVATIYNNLAFLYHSQKRYSEAEQLYNKALALKKRLLGEEDFAVTTSYNNLAFLYHSQKRYSEAEPLYIKALELRKRLLGEEHPAVANSYNSLAALYDSQGRYSEAEPLYINALELTQRLQGEKYPAVATIYNNLAVLYDSQGRYSKAEQHYIKALEIASKSLGINHLSTDTIRANLSSLRDKYA